MAINYIEKGIGLHRAITAAGYWLRQVDGVWLSSNDVAVQAIIDAYDDLPDYKAARIAVIKADGLGRVQLLYPAIATFEELLLVRDQWLSIAAAARAPVANFTKLINTYSAGSTAVSAVQSAVNKAGVDAVTVVWP